MRNMMGREKKALFIEQYTGFITDLGKQINSKAWWSTWLASRDAFSSQANSVFESIFLGTRTPTQLLNELPQRFWIRLLTTVRDSLKLAIRLLQNRSLLTACHKNYRKSYKNQNVRILKTFAFEKNFKEAQFADPYFSNLGNFLQQTTGVPTLTIYDFIGPIALAAQTSSKYKNAIALQCFMRWWDPLIGLCEVFIGLFKRFPNNARFANQDVTTLAKQLYRSDLLSRDAVYAFCVGYAFARMSADFKISDVIMTCENHPWERLAIYNLRKTSPDTKITSYQHSVVHEGLINMYLGKGETKFAPVADRLLTVGDVTAAQITHYGHYEHVSVISSCALRFEYLYRLGAKIPSAEKTILVVLSGIPQGASLLDYVLAEAKRLPEWKFIVREHPALTIADLSFRNKKEYRIELQTNVELSRSATIRDDLLKAKIVLYHSSAAALEALVLGIPVIAYQTANLLSLDPALECTHLHWTVDSDTRIDSVIGKIEETPESDLVQARMGARKFVEHYFRAVTPDSLSLFKSSATESSPVL